MPGQNQTYRNVHAHLMRYKIAFHAPPTSGSSGRGFQASDSRLPRLWCMQHAQYMHRTRGQVGQARAAFGRRFTNSMVVVIVGKGMRVSHNQPITRTRTHRRGGNGSKEPLAPKVSSEAGPLWDPACEAQEASPGIYCRAGVRCYYGATSPYIYILPLPVVCQSVISRGSSHTEPRRWRPSEWDEKVSTTASQSTTATKRSEIKSGACSQPCLVMAARPCSGIGATAAGLVVGPNPP